MSEGGPNLGVVPVGPGERSVLMALLDEYLGELAKHREFAVGATSAAEYRYLDAYFGEPGRFAFFILAQGDTAGFALIRGPQSTGQDWQVAEFFVRPQRRRSGVGRRAISLVWRRFPGTWQLQVHARNETAVAFWDASVRANSRSEPRVTTIDAPDGSRIQLEFETDPRGRTD